MRQKRRGRKSITVCASSLANTEASGLGHTGVAVDGELAVEHCCASLSLLWVGIWKFK